MPQFYNRGNYPRTWAVQRGLYGLRAVSDQVGRLNAEEVDDEDRSAGSLVVPEQDRIAFVKEFRFMLPRFWTLYESMEHSTYVASRLGIWKEPGRRKV